MIPLAELFRLFTLHTKKRHPLRLLNTYRGIPVSHLARIIKIHKGYLLLEVHPEQAACLSLEDKTYIQSELIPEVIKAQVVAINPSTRQVVLAEFTSAGTSLGKRLTVRVQPPQPVDVELYDGEHRVPGQLVDISLKGVGIFTVATYIYSDLCFERGTKVFIDICLPGTGEIIRLSARINSVIHQQGKFLHRLGLSILPSPKAEPALEQYVTQRQQEIMAELRLVAAAMSQGVAPQS